MPTVCHSGVVITFYWIYDVGVLHAGSRPIIWLLPIICDATFTPYVLVDVVSSVAK